MQVIIFLIGLNVSNVFVHGRPDKGVRTGGSLPEGRGRTHVQYALLNIVSDRCDNALGYGARIHIRTHTRIHVYICSEQYILKYEITY